MQQLLRREEVWIYILVRQSLLPPEDRKLIVVEQGRALAYDKVRSAMRLLGSKFFGELQDDHHLIRERSGGPAQEVLNLQQALVSYMEARSHLPEKTRRKDPVSRILASVCQQQGSFGQGKVSVQGIWERGRKRRIVMSCSFASPEALGSAASEAIESLSVSTTPGCYRVPPSP